MEYHLSEIAVEVSAVRLQKSLRRYGVQEQLAGRKGQREQFTQIPAQKVRDLSARIGSISGVTAPSLGSRSAQAVKAYWWVPAGFAVGLCGCLVLAAFPSTVGSLARLGSEWLTGGAGNPPAKIAVGIIVGAFYGMLLLTLGLIASKLSEWSFGKTPTTHV